MDDKRYASGSSLNTTAKEQQVDWFDRVLGDLSDDLFLGLKRLTGGQLKELTRLVQDVVHRSLDRGREERASKKQWKGVVRITVSGGVVVEVDGLPPGWKYEVQDEDE